MSRLSFSPLVRLTALAASMLLVGGLVGCAAEPAPSTESPAPVPSETAAPIFASDEEALAAAVAAYERYNLRSEEIASDPSVDPSSISDVIVPELVDESVAEFETVRQNGLQFEGHVVLNSPSLVERVERDGFAEVTIYICRDVSGVRILDQDGKDLTPPDRVDITPQQAFLISSDLSAETLIVENIVRWSGANFC